MCLLISRTELETDWEGLMSPTARSMGSKTRTYRQHRLASEHRTVGAGGTGGPVFGRSFNPISIRVDKLCPPHNYIRVSKVVADHGFEFSGE